MRNELDKFYTREEDVKKCLSFINLNDYDLIIEPSAGAGAFSNKIDNCLAYDILPDNENIIKQDFLLLNNIPNAEKILFIGNPPFGKRSGLAKAFIKKAIELNAYTIAFILPNTFKKFNNQSMFNDSWYLHKIIPTSETFLLNGEEIKIPCSFFIWSKEYTQNNLRDYKAKEPKEFKIISRNSKTADFSINGNNGKIKEIKDITNLKAEHLIKVKDGFNIDDIKQRLSKLTYDFNSSVNGGVAWINKNDIYKTWSERTIT